MKITPTDLRSNPKLEIVEQKYLLNALLLITCRVGAGILHGGIISTLLDEVITHIGIESFAGPAVTAQLKVRFRNPAPTGVKLLVTAKRIKMSRRLIEATAVVELSDSTVIATGIGKVMPVNDSFAPTHSNL